MVAVSHKDVGSAKDVLEGRVISLDRGFPLVKTATGELRAQHSIDLVKNSNLRAAVGDYVQLDAPTGQDIPLITQIKPRGHTLVRRSLVQSRHEGEGKYDEQILAANIDVVLVVCALSSKPVDTYYLERQLVLAHESGAEVAVVLSKSDQAKHLEEDCAAVRALAFDAPVIVESAVTGQGLQQILQLLAGGRTGVLLGRSGVGKSTLINELLGAPLLQTGEVRNKDRAGRHTTVARRMVFLHGVAGSATATAPKAPAAGAPPAPPAAIIDAPGLRSIGLYDAHRGLAAAFPDVVQQAAHCRYRDCSHTSEPACAAQQAVLQGRLSQARLTSYQLIASEVND